MSNETKVVALLVAVVALQAPGAAAARSANEIRRVPEEITENATKVLWRYPSDIASRNLYYGIGGKKDQPPTTFIFVKEDLEGSNPKFVVRDRRGVKWKIKLGLEARPETVASRLVWAAGYYTNEDYFLPKLRVLEMPAQLHRGRKLVSADGTMYNARLKRYLEGEKKIGNWEWGSDPFTGTRALNGLRVLMALIDNWDLKDVNNAVYREERRGSRGRPLLFYCVSDLGASFGSAGRSWPHQKAKGNLESYTRARFIRRVTPDFVDFETPERPALFYAVGKKEFLARLHLRWIGRNIPREDARWMGRLLARLAPAQIRDAFRAAAYSPEAVEGFSRVVEARIAELNRL